jgi:hypothetical protein
LNNQIIKEKNIKNIENHRRFPSAGLFQIQHGFIHLRALEVIEQKKNIAD